MAGGVTLIFAGLVLVALPALRRSLGSAPAHSGPVQSYGALLAGAARLIRSSPQLVQSAAMQFFAFATFNALWSVMTLHLTSERYGWSALATGLFNLAGLASGLATPVVGRHIDRFGAMRVAGPLLAVMLVAVGTVSLEAFQPVRFAISMFLLTWANQSLQSANQSRALGANPTRSAGADTVFMVRLFLGGAVGTQLGPIAYGVADMPGVAVLSIVPGGASAGRCGDDRREGVAQRLELRRRKAEPLDDEPRDALGFGPQRTTRGGELDDDLTFVCGIPRARDVAGRFEPLQQRRQRRGLELQRVAEVAHPVRTAIPEGEHHEVLRMRQPQRFEQRPVDRDHRAAGDGQREADLILEREWIPGRRRHIVSVLIIRELKKLRGFIDRLNRRLLPVLGPPPLGPYDEEPPVAPGCPMCGEPMVAHVIDRSGARTQVRCPGAAEA